jgi:MtN3 and saliva related transmembrane protein
MDTTFIIGNMAAILTSVSFLPQAIQVIKTKDTQSISLPMYLMFVIGVILWLTYGILQKDLPLMLANCVTLIFSSIILFYKVKETLSK